MEDRAKTTSVDHSSGSSSSYQNEKTWQQHEENTNALHLFPTHDDVPQGNARDGKPDHKDSAIHREHVQQHADAQRDMLPANEMPNGKRADGNGADFDDVPQSTSSRIERSRHMLGLQPQAPIVEEHDTADHVCVA